MAADRSEAGFWAAFSAAFLVLSLGGWYFVCRVSTITEGITTMIKEQYDGLPQIQSDVTEIKVHLTALDQRMIEMAVRLEKLEKER